MIILAYRPHDPDAKHDFDVMLAQHSTTLHTFAFLAMCYDPDNPGDVNHGSEAYPLGWIPLPK